MIASNLDAELPEAEPISRLEALAQGLRAIYDRSPLEIRLDRVLSDKYKEPKPKQVKVKKEPKPKRDPNTTCSCGKPLEAGQKGQCADCDERQRRFINIRRAGTPEQKALIPHRGRLRPSEQRLATEDIPDLCPKGEPGRKRHRQAKYQRPIDGKPDPSLPAGHAVYRTTSELLLTCFCGKLCRPGLTKCDFCAERKRRIRDILQYGTDEQKRQVKEMWLWPLDSVPMIFPTKRKMYLVEQYTPAAGEQLPEKRNRVVRVPRQLQPGERYCADCKEPHSTHRKMCEECAEKNRRYGNLRTYGTEADYAIYRQHLEANGMINPETGCTRRGPGWKIHYSWIPDVRPSTRTRKPVRLLGEPEGSPTVPVVMPGPIALKPVVPPLPNALVMPLTSAEMKAKVELPPTRHQQLSYQEQIRRSIRWTQSETEADTVVLGRAPRGKRSLPKPAPAPKPRKYTPEELLALERELLTPPPKPAPEKTLLELSDEEDQLRLDVMPEAKKRYDRAQRPLNAGPKKGGRSIDHYIAQDVQGMKDDLAQAREAQPAKLPKASEPRGSRIVPKVGIGRRAE
jgi:hypothetical protein